jgi:DNA uptake protein ComE-like DNA-binding protein
MKQKIIGGTAMRKIVLTGIIICWAVVFSGMSYAQYVQIQGSQRIGLIDVNSASKEQLMTLPGMDDITAESIINGRPYSDKEQLRLKEVISTAEYDTIKDLITVNPVPGAPK